MSEVAVEVTGDMETPPGPSRRVPSFSSILQMSMSNPDPTKWIQQQRQKVRPWLVFVQTSNFKLPLSIPRLSKRIMRNIEYFQANYLFVFLGLIVYCLITSPLILLAIAGTFYAGYRLNKRQLTGEKVVIFSKELTLAQQYGLVALCSLPVYYLVGAHGAMFWVIGASIFIITLHAAFYNIEAVETKEDEFTLLQEV